MAFSPPLRVMIVEDSLVIRGFINRLLSQNPDIRVVATAGNGRAALEAQEVALQKGEPIEVVILDIEMPLMDGMETLPQLVKRDPAIKVIMASTLTVRNADISLKALSLGAVDYIPKPTTISGVISAEKFGPEVLAKTLAHGENRRRKGAPSVAKPTCSLRTSASKSFQILAIGSSTGGPQALFEVFQGLGKDFPVPIVITQHMPPTFTTLLAEHITRQSGIQTFEGQEGMRLEPGKAYVAPGDFHMIIERKGFENCIALQKTPPENYTRPSVDPMLRSLIPIFDKHILVTILTGMGADGLHGSRQVVEKGGTLIAQDEETSVVWGMPGAVATAGLCSHVLPLKEIAPKIRQYFNLSPQHTSAVRNKAGAFLP